MPVGESSLNRPGEVPLRSSKTHLSSMDMDTQKDKTYSTQGGRIPQSVAYGSDIVPVGPTSSSDYGRSSMLLPSIGPENVIDDERKIAGSSEIAPEIAQEVEESTRILNKTPGDGIKTPIKTPADEIETPIKTPADEIETPFKTPGDGSITQEDIEKTCNLSGKGIEEKDRDETASIKSSYTAMECDEYRAAKRKKSHSADRSTSEDSEEELLKRVKVTRRQRIINDNDFATLLKVKSIQSRSNPDISQNPSEEEHRNTKKKREYKERKEIEETQEEKDERRREEKREYMRLKRKEEKSIAEKEKRKKEEKIRAETKVIERIGTKELIEKDLESMTASDIASRALEYLDHVDVIRTKCGTMQGTISGELKRRKLSLDMVRALHAKVEEKGDPQFLKGKIDELIKKNRLEEEKKEKEISELKKTVADLTRQNKEMWEELKSIRETLKKKNERYLFEERHEERSARKDSHLKNKENKENDENSSVKTYLRRYNDEDTHLKKYNEEDTQ